MTKCYKSIYSGSRSIYIADVGYVIIWLYGKPTVNHRTYNKLELQTLKNSKNYKEIKLNVIIEG